MVLLFSVLVIGAGGGAELTAAPPAMAEPPSYQSMYIQYRGALISDTHVPGEGKADGIAPEISSCVQASSDKWLVLYGSVDPRGHDINRSIFYQLRQGAPDGAVLKEGIIELAISGWDPLGVGHNFRKINAVVKVFGVPKGALRNGEPLPTANHFVVKWYIRPCLEMGGRLVNLWEPGSTVDPRTLGRYAYTLEWMQFRLNEAEDDIEIISPARELRQQGYDQGDVISSLGESKGIHHGFGDAVPNDSFTEWVEVLQCEKKLAAVRYAFDPATGLYEWVQTGNAQEVPDRHLAEASLNRIDNDWIISVRAYDAPWTAWYRTSDPFASFGDRTDVASPYVPRIAFVCADGVLRLFSNDTNWRNPLYSFDVDPITFEYSNKLYKTIPALLIVNIICAGSCYAQGKEDIAKDIGPSIAYNKGYREIGRMNLALSPIKGHSTGEGITVANNQVKLAPPLKLWNGHWDAGQFPLPAHGKIVLRVVWGRSETPHRPRSTASTVSTTPSSVQTPTYGLPLPIILTWSRRSGLIAYS